MAIATIAMLCAAAAIALILAARRRPASAGYILASIDGLPIAYQDMALREMHVTRRIGVTVTRREADRIVGNVIKVAREHGAIAVSL